MKYLRYNEIPSCLLSILICVILRYMFANKLDSIDLQLRKEIFDYAVETSPGEAADKYHEQIGMSRIGLYVRLKKYTNDKGIVPKPKGKKAEKPQEELTLSKSDKQLLARFEKGEVPLEEMSRRVAAIAFEAMLRNPGGVKYQDFIKTELLKLKQQEQKLSEKWGNQLLARMFAGKLPPSSCPKCGYSFMETVAQEGEIVHESTSLTTGV